MRSSAQPPTVSVTPLHGIIAAKLLRHPAIRNIDAERLLSAADALQKTDFDLGYSLLCRLANCVTPRFRNFARKILAKNETQDNWLINGAFCSELVAKYYALLELPLFNQVWEPHTISPNDLDRSHLVEVKGAILLQLDLNTQTSASHAAEKQPLRRPKVNNVAHTRSYVRDMARWNSMNIIVDRKSTGLFNQANSAVIKGRADLLESYKAFAQNVNAAIAFAKDNGDETNLDKVFDYADAATLVHVLTAEVVRRNAVLHSTEKPPDQVCAEDMVAELASRLYRQVSYNFNHTYALMSIRNARLAITKRDGKYQGNEWLTTERRKIFTKWLTLRKDRPVLEGLMDGLWQLSSRDTAKASQAEVRAIVIEALNNARSERYDKTNGD